MLSSSNHASAFGRPSTATSRSVRRPPSKDGEKQQIWVPMLSNASRGKDLAEKQLLILGGSPEQQRDFLEHLTPPPSRIRYNDRQQSRKAPISNNYALGYTYQNVLDGDQEDVLARLNIYMLSNASASFGALLKPLFTSYTVKDTLITILLDWADPLIWAKQLRQWIRLLREVVASLDEETKIAMEENINSWKEKRVGPEAPLTTQAGVSDGTDKTQPIALGPGEWDEALGLPLSVVCIQSEKIERLEREFAWQDEHFDFVTQWLRCVLLKHGASLVYTATFDSNNVRTLLHSTLSIHSLLKREIPKPSYIERDKILIPPSWDSWGKIRPLREGTDLEAISNAWSVEIQAPPEGSISIDTQHVPTTGAPDSNSDSAVGIYEATLPAPVLPATGLTTLSQEDTTPLATVQEFLASQLTVLDSLKADDEKVARQFSSSATNRRIATTGTNTATQDPDSTGMTDQIGPYQINVNGIDFDAEEATRRLKEREAERNATTSVNGGPTVQGSSAAKTTGATGTVTGMASGTGSGVNTPTRRTGANTGVGTVGEEGKASNEAMSAFFQNLIKKDRRGGGSGSERGGVSPSRTGSPAPGR